MHGPENVTVPIRIEYAILCEASEYTQTFCLGTCHIRKNLSSHAKICVLGEIVWLVSCADRHCLKVGVHELFRKRWITEITNITAWNQAHSSGL